MCGLFGWLKFDEKLTEEEIRQARLATTSLMHRGPDDAGEWRQNNVFMGHQRLKILDLSERAAQPFWSSDRRYVVTYNGEIYNYIELREELHKLGVTFQTDSDTEVFLAAFIAWGIDAFSRFEGMFVAAIHDAQTNVHYLVRDHLGQKPLYFHKYGLGIVYASELRALLTLDYFNWRIDRDNFVRFLMNSYYAWDTTPLKEVKKLLPGCFLKIQNGHIEFKRYWDSVPGNGLLHVDMEEAVSEFEQLFERACRICMRSDVPYGVLLSGGVDSSLVLSSCLQNNPDVAAYSVAMGEKDYDESEKARTISRHLGVNNHQVYTLDHEALNQTFQRFLGNLDEPHGDPGFVNMLFLAQSCRNDITVALAGDGGDELFAGYAPFAGLPLVPFLKKLPPSAISLARSFARNGLSASDGYLSLQFKALAYLQGFPATDVMRYPLWLATLLPKDLGSLCPHQPQEFFDPSGDPGTVFDFAGQVMSGLEEKSLVQQLLYFYQKVFLPEFVCLHTDRASMQFGFEVRSPFLLVSMINFANSLPDKVKLKGGVLKALLKCLMADGGFPAQILKQKKQGFTFPLARWLKSELKPWLDGLAKEEAWDGLVDRGVLKTLVDEHLSGKRNHYRILFNLIVFNAWRNNFPLVRVT